jgi:hypothetical protein
MKRMIMVAMKSWEKNKRVPLGLNCESFYFL